MTEYRQQQIHFAKYLKLGISYSTLIILSLIFMTPLLWLLSSSLHNLDSIFAVPYQWIPDKLHWDNYQTAMTIIPLGRYFLNTSFITVTVIIGTVLSSSLAAYGFARLNFKGRKVLFSLCIATMLLPGQITMIPLYVMFAKLGWVDTYFPLIVPAFLGSPFYIFLLRQFFLSIPYEYDEAALLDGASRLRIFWSIILPMARPAVATVVVFSFVGVWNDFFNPLIYINSIEKATLTLGLNMLKTQIIGSGVTQWHVMMAASVLVLIPNIVVFFLAQRHFMKGINVGGLRG
ncbi:MAG: carbohydrate ABC transporter permease [Deferribacteres bacterium]|nr:carbohydrate ABC transporter permease [candidate division KSB1 bacterium]MCB9512457.1 carbohydrate ABC transporter permease [Deferribacteres bacterium]